MEVEAKFSLPDHVTLARLRVTTRLAGFSLAKGQTRIIRDTYVDTPTRKILAGGYSCRFREEAEGVRATLKGVGGALGAIHKREEAEILLPSVQAPQDWPACSLREQVLQLSSGEALMPLFELQQTRIVRPVRWQGQAMAELSLDVVRVAIGDKEQVYREVEVELTPQGNEEQLVTIVDCLQKKWGLDPEPLSKFERALCLLDFGSGTIAMMAQVRDTLPGIAERDDWHGLRARAILALDKGRSMDETARQVGRSRRTIRRWQAAFRRSGLGIFPASLLEEFLPQASPSQAEIDMGEQPQSLVTVAEPVVTKIQLPDKPGLLAEDGMAEVTRKIMQFQFLHMLYHEPGTQLGQNIEELHDMRVATRRMRAALAVFGDYLDEKAWAPFEKEVRRLGRLLGAVRDLDVFWEKTQYYLETLPLDRKNELDPLRAVWQAEHERGRERLLAYLANEKFSRFKKAFGEFLETHEAGAPPVFNKAGEPQPRRLRDVAPVILYQRLAVVHAYDEWLSGTDVPLKRLHQLRIASKGLRYALEFLEEVLGKEAKALINELKGLQDHLGNLQDAVVASNLLRDYLTWGTWGHERTKKAVPLPTAPVVAPGVATYLAARQAELRDLPASFPAVWAHIQSTDFKQNLVSALSKL